MRLSKNDPRANSIDSISIYIKKSKNPSYDFSLKKDYLLKARELNDTLKNEIIKNINLSEIVEQALNLNDTNLFKETNREKLILSQKLNDSLHIGDAFYRYGNFYLAKEDLDNAYYSYHQAEKIYASINDHYNSGKMLYGMALILNDLRDYTGSEKLTFQAIKKLTPLKKNTSLYLCYNLLGINFHKLKEYDKALFYHQKALKNLEHSKDKSTYLEISLNNLGLTYHEMQQYNKAILYFKRALDNLKLKETNTGLYAALLDNLAYAQFLNGDTDIEETFNQALKIRDSLNNISGIVINKLHLAEFFISKGDTLKAKSYAKDASELAKSVNNHRDRLAALKLLANLDKKNASTYLEEHIDLNDSLQSQERAIRDKFTRIQFETDEYVEETKRLSLQNLLISTIGGSLLLVFVLLYFIKRQRAKNKELLFESEQQKINQEVYALMLKQQVKLEEGRLQERHRISEELHDGVLGKLFGTRIGLGYLALEDSKNNQEEFKSYINEIQQVENDIRDISHELKQDILTSKTDFASIIEDYVMTQCKLNRLQYQFSCDSKIPWNTIKDPIKVAMYRIVQEALQNTIKHAKANSITINFNFDPETLHLVISDNGVGFNIKNRKKGIGLKNMASRLDKINGQIAIMSEHGKGTTLDITIPL